MSYHSNGTLGCKDTVFLLVVITWLNEEDQQEQPLSWVSDFISWQGTGGPVQGYEHTWHLPVRAHVAGPRASLKRHPFTYTCVLRSLTPLQTRLFAPVPFKQFPATVSKDCHNSTVRNCSRASPDGWWHEEPVHLLFSLCQASQSNVRSCVHENDAIDLPTVGPKLCAVC